jgi:hypothetical protein
MKNIETLVAEMTKIVHAFGAVLAEHGRNSDESAAAYNLFHIAVEACRAVWLNNDPTKECHVKFSGAFYYSESIYLTAYVYDNADDLNEIETLDETRISCHAAAR